MNTKLDPMSDPVLKRVGWHRHYLPEDVWSQPKVKVNTILGAVMVAYVAE